MIKLKNGTIKHRLIKILKEHGSNTTYNFANNLYLSIYGETLAKATFYLYRTKHKLEKQSGSSRPYTQDEISNFLTAAEKEAGIPITVESESGRAKDVYTLQELMKVKELAKELGGLQYLQEAVTAVQELQE